MDVLEKTDRIASITLDDMSIIRRAPEVERERQTAIADLIAANYFAPAGLEQGPYDVVLSARDNRLGFRISSESMDEPEYIFLAIKPFQRIIKDYFLMVESYLAAINGGQPHRIEAIDMGRRGVHNEGSELLQNSLEDKINLDFDTARRLFTLICVLHIK